MTAPRPSHPSADLGVTAGRRRFVEWSPLDWRCCERAVKCIGGCTCEYVCCCLECGNKHVGRHG